MSTDITSALIGAGGTVLAALIGKLPLQNALSFWARRRNNIPDIMKTRWSAEWFNADGSPYVKDQVTFSKWTKNANFEGYGEVIHGNTQYKYSIVGEVSPSRIVVLTYKAERFPTEASIGTACLELSDNAEELSGQWAGRRSFMQGDQKVYTVRAGKVKMRKVKSLNK